MIASESTKSATCRFKMSFLTEAKVPMKHAFEAEKAVISYSGGPEDETDTVSFMDLDTNAPKVVSNGSQEDLLNPA